jgi:hypothetical protein
MKQIIFRCKLLTGIQIFSILMVPGEIRFMFKFSGFKCAHDYYGGGWCITVAMQG